MFQNKNPTLDHCFYGVWIRVSGTWRLIQVTDEMPCKNIKSGSVFMRYNNAKQLQIWPSLIEKAYAKSFGCYEYLVGGSYMNALEDLSGVPC